MVSKLQNCELKQEPCTLSTELQQTHELHGHGKTRSKHTYNRATTNLRFTRSRKKQETSTLSTELQQTHEFQCHGKNIYSSAPEMWGRNCSEIVTSGRIFVLTLNRASAVKVEDSEPNFLLPQNIVAITEESV